MYLGYKSKLRRKRYQIYEKRMKKLSGNSDSQTYYSSSNNFPCMTNKEYRLLTSRPSRMQSGNINDPKDALESFFSSFTLDDCRNYLWELYERCVMSYARERTVHETAPDILFFYTHTEMLIEAAWLMNNKHKRKMKKRERVASGQQEHT